MSDFSSTSTSDDDAFDELSYDYSSYDSPSDSTGPSTFGSPNTSGLLGNNQSWNSAWDTYYGDGGKDPYMDWLGNEVGFESANARTRAVREQMQQEMYNRNRAQAPAHERSLQQQIPISPIDFSRPPTGPNPNFKTIVNPYVPTEAMKGTQGSILNQMPQGIRDNISSMINPTGQQIAAMNAQAAAGQQVAHSGQIMTDAITLPEKGQMSDKQVVEVLNRRPDASTIHAVDYEPYGSNGYASLLGVPIGEMQDSYKPVYSYEDQNAINNWRMGTDLYNTRGGMSDADQASISRGNFDVYPENFVMIDGKPVSRNNLGSNGGADGGFNFNFNMPGIGSFSNMEGRQESLGFPNQTLTWQEEEAQAIRNNPESFIPDHGGRIESSMPVLNVVGAGLGITGAVLKQALAKVNVKSMTELTTKYGNEFAKIFKEAVKDMREPGLTKIANQSFRKDNVPTVTELGLMKAAVRNKAGLGTHTPKELGTINRNITKADQHPNFLSNKAFRKARIDKGEVKANVHPNTLNPSKNVPVNVHKQPPKGTTRDLGGMGAKGANKEDIRNMATALKLEANKKTTKLMADNKRIIAKNKKAKAKKAKKANKKRK